MEDFYSNNTVAVGNSCASLDADEDGNSVDLQGYENASFIAIIGVGGITFTGTNKIEFELEESDDDSTFTDVAAADMIMAGSVAGEFGEAISAATDDTVFTVTYIGSKRYVRPVINFSGTHGTATPVAVINIKHGKKYRPAN